MVFVASVQFQEEKEAAADVILHKSVATISFLSLLKK
jgi:hypothetical protein